LLLLGENTEDNSSKATQQQEPNSENSTCVCCSRWQVRKTCYMACRDRRRRRQRCRLVVSVPIR
jgi:hypothetical protein